MNSNVVGKSAVAKTKRDLPKSWNFLRGQDRVCVDLLATSYPLCVSLGIEKLRRDVWSKRESRCCSGSQE